MSDKKREGLYKRVAESAERDFAAWPEWKKHPPMVYRCDKPGCPFHHRTPEGRCD
jgi:hypothetical protein